MHLARAGIAGEHLLFAVGRAGAAFVAALLVVSAGGISGSPSSVESVSASPLPGMTRKPRTGALALGEVQSGGNVGELFPTNSGVMHEASLHKNALIGFTTSSYSFRLAFKRLALLRLHLPIPPLSPDLNVSHIRTSHLTPQHWLLCHLG